MNEWLNVRYWHKADMPAEPLLRPNLYLSVIHFMGVKEVAVAQLNEKQLRPGFFQSAPGQVTLLIATMVVMLIFAWSYI